MNRLAYTTILSITAAATPLASASTADDIRTLLDEGNYSEAFDMAKKALDDKENSSLAGSLNELAGEALWLMKGHDEEAKTYFEEARRKGVADASLYLGRMAMLDYNFPEAQKSYGEYKRLKIKSRKPLADYFEFEENGVAVGNKQFERVREVIVIDAVEVDRKNFFKHMRLPASAGRLMAIDDMPLPRDGRERNEIGFSSEHGDTYLWSEMNDSTGYLTIAEASRLADGSLSTTHYAPDFLAEESDALFPFLSADGTTLYYASDCKGSIGGYDIFMASRDPQTGDYMQPVNAGIPFNSAADDFMMAIDEENGVGWWASDRRRLPDDKVTLFVYLLSDERKNLEADPETLRKWSRLDDFRLTWEEPTPFNDEDDQDDEDDQEGADSKPAAPALSPEELEAQKRERFKEYEAKRAEIARIVPGSGKKKNKTGLEIPLKGGESICSPDDVKTAEQKMLVEKIMEMQKVCNANAGELKNKRREYASKPSPHLGKEILAMERALALEEASLTKQKSLLYRMLGYK